MFDSLFRHKWDYDVKVAYHLSSVEVGDRFSVVPQNASLVKWEHRELQTLHTPVRIRYGAQMKKEKIQLILLRILWLLGVDRNEVPDYHKKIEELIKEVQKL